MRLLVSGTIRSVSRLAQNRRHYLGILTTPNNRNSVQSICATGLPWAIDNGAFSGFDEMKFLGLVERAAKQPNLLWIAVPDVVANAPATVRRWREWQERLTGFPLAFVGQDGQEDLALPDNATALFIGGSTGWKLSRCAADLCREAKQRGWLVHMGRVNSYRRMRTAADFGCDTIDGSSASMFGDKYIHKYISWLRQIDQQLSLFP
jgi:hypothetical protein